MPNEYTEEVTQLLERAKGESLFSFNKDHVFQAVIDGRMIRGSWELLDDGLLLTNEAKEKSYLKLVELIADRLILELTIYSDKKELILLQELIPTEKRIEEVLEESKNGVNCQSPIFSDVLPSLPGINPVFFEVEGAISCALKELRPIFIIVSELNCITCLKEIGYFSNPSIQKYLNDNYLVVVLYLDAKNTLEIGEKLKTNNIKWLKSNKLDVDVPFYISYNPITNTVIDSLNHIENDIILKRFLLEGKEAFKK